MDWKYRSIFVSVLSLFVILMLNAQIAGADNTTFTPSRHDHDEGKPTPLSPRAHPYALAAGSGIVNVRFSVRMMGKKNQATAVYLRRTGVQESIAMNDQGVNGDHRAGDNIYGASIPVDTSALASDTCLSYEAFINSDRAEVVSAPLQLCVSSLPLRATASNITQSVVLADGSKAIADEILIIAQPGTKAVDIRRLATSINANIVGGIPPHNLYQLKLSAPATTTSLSALIEQLLTHPEVKSASINAIGHSSSVPSDPEYVNQQGLQLIRAQDVWDAGATGGGVIVTVLDSGIDRTHPDFGTAGNCQLVDNDCGATSTDTVGHGTQVAGVIAAKTNNAVGVAGIAYGSKIKSLQVSTTASVSLVQMIQGFTDAAAYGAASVINASFDVMVSPSTNVSGLCSSINSAVLNGTTPVAVVVVAAGNSNANGYYYPGRCNINDSINHVGQHETLTRKDLFITVANSASVIDLACGSVAVDQRCSTSNYGAWVDISAPGSSIRTTASGGGYASPTGTSLSAPMVSSAAAILKSCGVPLNQIESTLRTAQT